MHQGDDAHETIIRAWIGGPCLHLKKEKKSIYLSFYIYILHYKPSRKYGLALVRVM